MKTLLIYLFLIVTTALFAQTAEERMAQLKDSLALESIAPEDEMLSNEKQKARLGMNIGTSYSFASGYGSGMSLYAAPTLTMPVTDRLSMHAGIIASSFYPVSSGFQNETGMPAMYSSLSLFAAASYRMNDRLTLHGAGTKQLVNAPVSTPFTTYPVDNLSVGATYRLGNNITIGASVTLRNTSGYYNAPYFGYPASPFGGPGPFSPYGW